MEDKGKGKAFIERGAIFLEPKDGLTVATVSSALDLMLMPKYMCIFQSDSAAVLVSEDSSIGILAADYSTFVETSMAEIRRKKTLSLEMPLICIDCPKKCQEKLKALDANHKYVFIESKGEPVVKGMPTDLLIGKGNGKMPYRLLIEILKALDMMPEDSK